MDAVSELLNITHTTAVPDATTTTAANAIGDDTLDIVASPLAAPVGGVGSVTNYCQPKYWDDDTDRRINKACRFLCNCKDGVDCNDDGSCPGNDPCPPGYEGMTGRV